MWGVQQIYTFGRRCIPAVVVANRSHIPDMLALGAWPVERIASLRVQICQTHHTRMTPSMVSVWVLLPVAFVLVAALALVARRLNTTRERLDRLESRLAAVLEASDAGLAVWDPDGRLLVCNKRFREFYPTVQLKPGLVFEDLTRLTATRGLVQMPEDQMETWVDARLAGFGDVGHDRLRTSDGRWLQIDMRSTGSGEVLLLYTDTTHLLEIEATLSDRSEQLARQSADLTLLIDAIRIASMETSPESATAAVVALVCVWAAWPVGYAYRVSGPSDDLMLDPMPAWFADADAVQTCPGLRTMVEQRRVKRGEGPAGRALDTGRVSWIPHVAVDPAIEPETRSAMAGIRGACAVPVKHGDAVVVVLEFLAREQLVPDPSATRLLEAVAGTLGRVWRARADP